MYDSQWQTPELTETYLKGVRGAIPLAAAQLDLILKLVQTWCPHPRSAVDLGCGDGILGRMILERFPGTRVWFLDFSEPMLEAARAKVGPDARAAIIQSDFATPDWSAPLAGRTDIDLVLSAYAIHHQPDVRKRELYAEVYELLAPGGLFLNLDHVASPTASIEAVFDDYFVDHLLAFHRQSEPDTGRREIAETYYGRPDKQENILAAVEEQCAWLRQINFQDVDCFFKLLELALFGGRKPRAK